MKLSDYDFDLPESLIATRPLENRTDSKLLCFDRKNFRIDHKNFLDIISFLSPNDLLILNNTKVIPARLFGQKETGGKVEIFIERILPDNKALAHIKSSKAPKEETFILIGDYKIKICGRDNTGRLFYIELTDFFQKGKENQSEKNNLFNFESLLQKYGEVPLPPYMKRTPDEADKERYQTVFAVKEGSVAAPTAGLHFDNDLIKKISKKGIDIANVTLHVGSGTFQPVQVDNIKEHKMHSEYMEINAETCDKIIEAKARGGRVVAVGTTSVRSLESAAYGKDQIKPYFGDTDIFITPGYEFKIVDAIITNFHLPKSTLLMLVSAFAGLDNIKNLYREAINNSYRFYSYGDSMFLY